MKTKPTIYTTEFVTHELATMLAEVTNNTGIFFIGQLFENRPYSRQRFSEWVTKFKDDAEITDVIKRIEGLLETRLVEGSLTGALNPTMTIFTLKNKHGWRDKTEQEITGDGVIQPILVKFVEGKQINEPSD